MFHSSFSVATTQHSCYGSPVWAVQGGTEKRFLVPDSKLLWLTVTGCIDEALSRVLSLVMIVDVITSLQDSGS